MDNLKAIKALILEDAAFWDAQMNEVKLRAWSDQLRKYPAPSVKDAMLHFRAEKGRTRMPMPADIISAFGANISSEAEATRAVERTQKAIVDFGYMRGKEAQVYIGSLGWEVIKSYGGWQRVCEDLGVNIDRGVFFAQAVKIAKSKSEYARAGRTDEAPALPEPSRKSGLSSAAEILGLLSPKPEESK